MSFFLHFQPLADKVDGEICEHGSGKQLWAAAQLVCRAMLYRRMLSKYVAAHVAVVRARTVHSVATVAAGAGVVLR